MIDIILSCVSARDDFVCSQLNNNHKSIIGHLILDKAQMHQYLKRDSNICMVLMEVYQDTVHLTDNEEYKLTLVSLQLL